MKVVLMVLLRSQFEISQCQVNLTDLHAIVFMFECKNYEFILYGFLDIWY